MGIVFTALGPKTLYWLINGGVMPQAMLGLCGFGHASQAFRREALKKYRK
jgi:hypothetical protein